MPSMNTYSYLPIDGKSSSLMNVETEQNKTDILLAIHLCRIVVRALEVNAFRALQRKVNGLPNNKYSDADLHRLVAQLIKLMFSLRRRVSWWTEFGSGRSLQDSSKDTHAKRVTMLIQSLYYWYFAIRKKISATSSHSPSANDDQSSDDLPDDESKAGFDDWMARGIPLIHKFRSSDPERHPQSLLANSF